MKENSYSIWIEAEEWATGEWNVNNDNTDVKVEFIQGSKWVASFFTYQNIQTLSERNRKSGEFLDGKFLWASNMILVDECSRNRIEEIVEHLINTQQFERIFSKCND